MTDAEHRSPDAHALLTDGTTVLIRPVGPEDHDEVLRLYEEMAPESLRARFFAAGTHLGQRAAERACAGDRPGYRALAALAAGRIIGIAEYERTEIDPTTAELALAVAEGWHHRGGVGTLLLEHLVHAARRDGIAAFVADALADNHLMLRVFADLGLPVSRRFAGSEVHCAVRLDIGEEHYLRAVDERARVADAASLRSVLCPECVAVVGAGRRSGSAGREVLRNIRRGGFGGLLYAVNPHAHAWPAVDSARSCSVRPPQIPKPMWCRSEKSRQRALTGHRWQSAVAACSRCLRAGSGSRPLGGKNNSECPAHRAVCRQKAAASGSG